MRRWLDSLLITAIFLTSYTPVICSPIKDTTVKATLITTIPFHQFIDGVIMIHAKLDTFSDTLNFILDTGSGGISLDSTTVSLLHIPTQPSDKVIHGIGGSREVPFAYNHTLVFPGLKVDSLDFHINNYDLISALYGIHIDGIIGYSFLDRYIVKIDYDSQMVSVYTPGTFKYSHDGELLYPLLVGIPVLPEPIKSNHVVNSRFFFDTGAGLCLLLNNQFVSDNDLLPHKKRKRRHIYKTEAQGLLGKMEMRITTMQEMKVGTYTFHNVPALLFDDISNITSYPFLGGIIGNELLRRFNLVLDYPAHEIHINPNSHFRDPFDYSYTGMSIYFLDGEVQITTVIDGSPADKAGFKPGDVIIGINNNFSGNIQEYIGMLKNPGTRARIVILRNHSLKIKNLQIKSFL
jgi:PDZ domain/Aspartyl protease